MDEKIIIQEKAEKKGAKKSLILLVFLVVLFVVLYIAAEWISDIKWDYWENNRSMYDMLDSLYYATEPIAYLILFAIAVCIVYCIAMWFMSKCEIAVTSVRVYGRTWKEQVDLPLDSISAVKKGMFKSVGVATSSGKVSFSLLKKQNEIFDAVSTLLKERQNKPVETVAEKKPASTADELKEYKSLLDAGIITQEEFDAKKKQLLGL